MSVVDILDLRSCISKTNAWYHISKQIGDEEACLNEIADSVFALFKPELTVYFKFNKEEATLTAYNCKNEYDGTFEYVSQFDMYNFIGFDMISHYSVYGLDNKTYKFNSFMYDSFVNMFHTMMNASNLTYVLVK